MIERISWIIINISLVLSLLLAGFSIGRYYEKTEIRDELDECLFKGETDKLSALCKLPNGNSLLRISDREYVLWGDVQSPPREE